jgi:nitrite reductase (NO-forming)
VFDHVYLYAGVLSPSLQGVQTISVPPGGAAIVDMKIRRAARFTLVDHALSRIERGLVGFLIVDGPREDDIMHSGPAKR